MTDTDDILQTRGLTKEFRGFVAVKRVSLVEHNLGVVAQLCDRITVLARGEILAEGDYQAVSRHPQVVEADLGAAHA